MRRFLSTILALVLAASAAFAASDGLVRVDSKDLTLLLKAEQGKPLQYIYFGPYLKRLEDALNGGGPGLMNHEIWEFHNGPAGVNVCPVYGQGETREYSLAVTHADGNMSLQLLVDGVSTVLDGDATITKVALKDPVYPFCVEVCYRSFEDAAMIETWIEVSHKEKKNVLLRRFDSISLPLRRGDVWCSHFYGTWANDARLVEEPVLPGVLMIENKDGVRNAAFAHSEVMFSLDGKPQENCGDVIGAALCYTGNYQIRVHTSDTDYSTFYAGMCSDNSEYPLAPKEVFKTPVVAFTYSKEGKSGVSRNFHRWANKHWMIHGGEVRNILLNSWEGVYFDVNEPKMVQMMKDIKAMGGELFVMDDGWFGVKYPRVIDKMALGDWEVDRNKLPGGISSLVQRAKENGLKFGLWLEPEMVNTTSELYEKHPDWVINAAGRDLCVGRGMTQLVLDLSNPKVQDYIFSVVDKIMKENPELAYIKWDANMNLRSHGSQYLKADEQSKLEIEYHKGLISIMERIRASYPDLVIQTCASGGGRMNFGYLKYFDEFWTSDNTDALQRVYMQWGSSHFFPACAMGCHIAASPNHQTGRLIPLKYRVDVAMSGRLGMEIQPQNMAPEEIALCKKAIGEYKAVRNTIQLGDVYRLVSPYDGLGLASLMYVSEDKNESVFYWYRTEYFIDQHLPRVKMAGLDPDKIYTVTELDRLDDALLPFEGKTFSGEYLMNVGLEIPGDLDNVEYQATYSSRVLKLSSK